MGLFDKFRKKVREAASEIDTESISAEEGSIEANEALDFKQELTQKPEQSNDEDYWEDIDETENLELPSSSDDDWDDWDEEEEYTLPTKLTRREKKILAKEAKAQLKRVKAKEAELKKRGEKKSENLLEPK